jgi:NAD(P)-dependent dehydrogenase (short-subunit alcohol dehydrogenase family)
MNLMLPLHSFQGKTILITGGGSGLGLSMAEGLLRLGAQVALMSRNEEKLQKAAEKLTSDTGGKVITFSADVRDAAKVEEGIQFIVEMAGGLHGVVNNAAGNFISPTERLSANAFSSVIDIVLKGTVHTTMAAGKYWMEQKQPGTFVNIVTTYASTGSGYVVPSATAKAGVIALTRSLAVEWAKYGIRTNAIAPGPFPTEGAWSRLFPKEALPPDLAEKMDPASKIPLNRVGHHEELVNLVSFLLSEFSGFINGEVVTIDGGEWLQGAGEFNWLNAVPSKMWDAIEAATRKGK